MATATLNSLNPTTAEPGDVLTLNGADFEAGARVVYFAEEHSVEDAAPTVLSAIAMTSTVPDVLLGLGGQITVAVRNPSPAGNSNALPLAIGDVPDVEDSAPLCAVGAVRRLLAVGLSESYDNNRLRGLIETASAQIRWFCRKDFKLTAHTNEKYDGDGTSMLVLRDTPINTVSALSIQGQAVDLATLKVYDDYIAFDDAGDYDPRLRQVGGIFPAGRQNISVTYTAGYAKIPRVVADAAALQTVFLINTAQKQGVETEGIQSQGINTTWRLDDLAEAVRRMLQGFRKVTVKLV